ncbi:MAG: hypothetical protein KDI20_16100, partial [Pseudomonadales bacterium]|nr:hypothetical protein [Pseudomonadales bacterium]
NQILVCFFLVAAVVHLLAISLEGGEYIQMFIAVMIFELSIFYQSGEFNSVFIRDSQPKINPILI